MRVAVSAVQSRSRIYTESIKEGCEINHQRSLDGPSSFASGKSLLLTDYCKQSSRLHSVSTFSFEQNKESERFKKTHRLLYILVNEFREILYSLENFFKKAFGLLLLALPERAFRIEWDVRRLISGPKFRGSKMSGISWALARTGLPRDVNADKTWITRSTCGLFDPFWLKVILFGFL